MSYKGWIRRKVNGALEPFGFQVVRFSPEASARRVLSGELRALQVRCFRKDLRTALSDFPGLTLDGVLDQEIEALMEDIASCPVRQQFGGSGVNAALLLWALSRVLRPALVVESGVLRGFTTWVLERAAPDAEIHSFDVSFSELQFRCPRVHYHECDWMAMSLAAATSQLAVAFFDDHVDQWRRVREAAERGFRYLIFDDSLPAQALHGDGEAAFPTLDMLFDSARTDGEVIEWKTESGVFSFRYNEAVAFATRNLVKRCVRLPSLHLCTGYSPANLTLVETIAT